MYAIINAGGKQYKVAEGDVIYVEKIPGEAGMAVNFNSIAYGDGNGILTGSPTLENVSVIGKILKTDRAKKIVVFTYKAKKNCKRKMGHRQWYTKIQIEKIEQK